MRVTVKPYHESEFHPGETTNAFKEIIRNLNEIEVQYDIEQNDDGLVTQLQWTGHFPIERMIAWANDICTVFPYSVKFIGEHGLINITVATGATL